MTTSGIHSQLHLLHLVHPPMSNQEAEWLKSSDEVRARLRSSNLYMLVRRHEARFENLRADDDAIAFDFTVPEFGKDPVELRFGNYPDAGYFVPDEMDVEAGEKMVRAWRLSDDSSTRIEVEDWFSTESLLWQRSRGHPVIHGLDRYREFMRYELLYTGISKDADSFTRTILRPHEKRVSILSNEHPLAPGSRVTDELFLLFFRVEPLSIQSYEITEDLKVEPPGESMDKMRIVADAEKAITSIAKGRYNTVTFREYPKGKDGLYDTGLWRYCYIVAEDLTLWTPHATIRGRRCVAQGIPSNEADAIFVDAETVRLRTPEQLASEQTE